jgi:hypothetical protein
VIIVNEMTRDDFINQIGSVNKDCIQFNIDEREMGEYEWGIRRVKIYTVCEWQLYWSYKDGRYVVVGTYDTVNKAYYRLFEKLRQFQGSEILYDDIETRSGYHDPYEKYLEKYPKAMNEDVFKQEYKRLQLEKYEYHIYDNFYQIHECEIGIFRENERWNYYETFEREGNNKYSVRKSFALKGDALKYLLAHLEGTKISDDQWRVEQEKRKQEKK